ncbi:hypothetical protein GTQ99_00350 [Kineococcus sp. T13]|uniref:hypothetical protein n=1 Tax=Kineococcus vitellinus TaxID=2696565 RepID=UPI0014132E1D|nr:hypothetical protein [Kineococcus vitellinus]NAZ73881.1 hypothetical protein [Kineococcus vitellinus]
MIKFLLFLIVLVLCWPLGLLVGAGWLAWTTVRLLTKGTVAVTRGTYKVSSNVVTAARTERNGEWVSMPIPRVADKP